MKRCLRTAQLRSEPNVVGYCRSSVSDFDRL